MQPVIELTQVSFDYLDEEQRFRALHSVDITVMPGDYIAIVGASGSGKSTLLNVIGLLAPPTDGCFRLGGVDATSLSEQERAIARRENIGFVFQQFNLLPRLTARENVLLPVAYLGDISTEERTALQTRADALLAELGVADRADRLPSEMSGGQKQRVAICRALLLDPSIILADEPTGALDAKTTRDVLAILDSLRTRGKTVVVITHDREVASHADRQIFLKDGRVDSDVQSTQQIRETQSPKQAPLVRNISLRERLASRLGTLAHETLFAWKTLASHKLRSFLTGLGLLIGVTSIVFVAGLGEVAERAFTTLFLSPATKKVYIGQDNHGSPRKSKRYWKGLDSERDFPALRARFADVGLIRPILSGDTCSIISRSRSTRTRFQGVFDAQEYLDFDTPLEAGRFPSDMEMESGVPLVVLGSESVDALFAPNYPGRANGDFPVGEKLAATSCQISQTFTVVGVFKRQDLMFMRKDANDLLYAPVQALIKAGADSIFRKGISAMPNKGVDPRWLADSISNYLSLREAGQIDFFTMVPAEILSKVQMMLTILQALTGFIGALCIGVGGIGIMNIMLVSVRERIREIGVSKSIGGTPQQIKRQFLTESVTLCLVAGGVGVFVGFLCNNTVAFALSRAFPKLGAYSVIFAWNGTVIALLVSAACGIGFGLYPALRAARVNPAECLREE